MTTCSSDGGCGVGEPCAGPSSGQTLPCAAKKAPLISVQAMPVCSPFSHSPFPFLPLASPAPAFIKFPFLSFLWKNHLSGMSEDLWEAYCLM